MQAAPPPEAQVLPETAETMPPGARPAAGRASPAPAARPAAAPKPAHLAPAERIQAEPQPAAFREAPAEPATATSAPMPDADVSGETMIPRRPVVEGAGRSRADVPWLGIGS